MKVNEKTITVAFQVPNLDAPHIRNGILATVAFGVSSALSADSLFKGEYKKAFGSAVVSFISIGIAVDLLASNPTPSQPGETENKEDIGADYIKLCDGIAQTTAHLSDGENASSLPKIHFKKESTSQIWNNFQKALQVALKAQKSMPGISSRKMNLASTTANLSPASKGAFLLEQDSPVN